MSVRREPLEQSEDLHLREKWRVAEGLASSLEPWSVPTLMGWSAIQTQATTKCQALPQETQTIPSVAKETGKQNTFSQFYTQSCSKSHLALSFDIHFLSLKLKIG